MANRRERSRCDEIRSEPDRRAYLLAHAMRRIQIGQALEVDPVHLRFSRDAQGKPLLAWPAPGRIGFSLSHTRELAICVLTAAGDIGVDAEAIRGDADFSLLAPYIASLDEKQGSPECFFFHWTALEAFWKAHGIGLSTANPRIRVRATQEGLYEASFEHDPPGLRRARLMPLPPRSGCAITVALRTPGVHRAARSEDELVPGSKAQAGKLCQSSTNNPMNLVRPLTTPRRNVA